MKRIYFLFVFLTIVSMSWAQEMTEESEVIHHNSFGAGFGIPYGILGANVDINLVQNLNASLGLGTTILAGVGYNFGFKYYLTSAQNGFRPRVLAMYGINAMSAIGDDTETYTGLSLGAGFQWMWGKTKSNGLDIDVIYVATTGYDIDELEERYGSRYKIEELGKIKISIGYRRAF